MREREREWEENERKEWEKRAKGERGGILAPRLRIFAGYFLVGKNAIAVFSP